MRNSGKFFIDKLMKRVMPPSEGPTHQPTEIEISIDLMKGTSTSIFIINENKLILTKLERNWRSAY